MLAKTMRFRESTFNNLRSLMLGTHSVAQADLKYRPILLRQVASHSRMTTSKLQKVPEQWYSRDLRQILDLWGIRSVEVAEYEVNNCYQRDANGL